MDNEEFKRELMLMITEYWAIDNNETCSEATLLFLERNDLLNDFNKYKDLDVEKVSDETKKDYFNNLKYY